MTASSRDLANVQEFIARAVQKRTPLAEHADIATATPGMIAGSARLSPVEQLDIYREQFWLRHLDALEEDFVSLVVLLGHDGFHALAEEYLEANPPDSYTLRELGAKLAEFLATSPKYAADTLLSELARLEWCFVDAFDAADAPPLDTSAIAGAGEDDWPRARVELHPSVKRIALEHASHDYRAEARRFHSGERETTPERPEKRRVPLVVYRGPTVLHYWEIEPAAFALLEALGRGEPLEAACDVAAKAAGAADASTLEPHVGRWFQEWTAMGWVSAVRF